MNTIKHINQFENLPDNINIDILDGTKCSIITPGYWFNPILDEYVNRIIRTFPYHFNGFLRGQVYYDVPTFLLKIFHKQLMIDKNKEIINWWNTNHPEKIQNAINKAKEDQTELVIYFRSNTLNKDCKIKECWSTYITPDGEIITSVEYKPESFNDKILSNLFNII